MVKITVELDEDEYLQAKRTGKTHKEIYAQGLGRDYVPKTTGRPKAFDPDAYEAKMRQIWADKIKAYNEAHQAEADEARRVLGIDLKPGQSVPAQGLKKYQKKRG